MKGRLLVPDELADAKKRYDDMTRNMSEHHVSIVEGEHDFYDNSLIRSAQILYRQIKVMEEGG